MKKTNNVIESDIKRKGYSVTEVKDCGQYFSQDIVSRAICVYDKNGAFLIACHMYQYHTIEECQRHCDGFVRNAEKYHWKNLPYTTREERVRINDIPL